MKSDLPKACPQVKRALRLLLSPSAPRIDQQKLIDALPGPTPIRQKELIDLIIQIVLALMENKDGEKEEKPNGPGDVYETLRNTAATVACETIPAVTLEQDLPKLIASIASITAIIPVPGFDNFRQARETMRVANNEALGFSAKMWLKWNAAIRNELDHLDQAGHLGTYDEYKLAWTAIVEGLETIE